MANLTVQPARSLQGELVLPGDKSISHRAFLLGALCHGPTRILHCLAADDVNRSRSAVEALGVSVRREGEAWVVDGKGIGGFRVPGGRLDMGNSGTTTRLLLGILAGCPFETTLFGDASLSNRPMRRVTEPLQKMGVAIRGENGADRLPLTIRGGGLKGIRHTPAVPSAQVKSALLLAGLSAEGPTTVVEPVPTRDHTERMLRYMGACVESHPRESEDRGPRLKISRTTCGSIPAFAGMTPNLTGQIITIKPGSKMQGREIEVPGDFSSAAFFLVAAAIVAGSSVTIRRVGLNPTRTGLLDLLRRMGAKISIIARSAATKQSPRGHKEIASLPSVARNDELEPIGDITVSYAPLKAITVEPSLIPGIIDELPILMVAASQADGISRMEGVGELRVKETDRIRSMVTGLSAMGAGICSEGDTVIVEGPRRLQGAAVDSFGDHRTAMALAVAALAAKGPTRVHGGEWINISFPGFSGCLKKIRH